MKRLLLMISIVLGVIVLYMLYHFIFSTKFNSEVWLHQPKLRHEMSGDLINSEILLGKTIQEVIEILGSDYEKDGVNQNTIFYIIDWNSYGGDPEVLFIKFKNEKVISVGRMVS